ncbi:MAG: WecB/TagA/CpsF family glycosyltransferase [Patescibacteria group bacterium]
MKLMDVQIDEITREEARETLKKPQIIFTPNPEILLEARKNAAFRQALKKGTLMLPDGHGLLLVSTLLQIKFKFIRAFAYLPSLLLFLVWKHPFKKVFPEIIHGSDFMEDVIAWSEKNKKSVFFLGGKIGVAKKTAQVFKEKYPHLKVAGSSTENPSTKAFEIVKASKADVLFVAYGAPKQELWIAEYARKIPTLVHVMGVGGSFDFWSGAVKRAPRLLRKLGLEWMWRLFLQPLQRTRRIYNATIKFPFLSLFFDDR